MAQSQDVWAGMPWQVKALAFVGFPVVAAVAFGWVVLVDVRTNQKSVLDLATSTVQSLEKHGDEMRTGQVETMRMLRALCLNGANSERAAQNCEDPWSAKWPREQRPTPVEPSRMFDR